MLKKIISIKNVWKYKNYSFLGGSENEFIENNLIFGENANGKSTFTAIFKALSTWNKDYIIGRKTFWSDSSQEIELLIDSNHLKFSDNNFQYNNIEIFDSEFISKNVFYGDEITRNEQWNLYEIFLDASIKTIKNELEDLERLKKNKESDKQDYISTNFNIRWTNIHDFRKLPEDTEIDNKILQKQQEIKQAENKDGIKQLIRSSIFGNDFSWLVQVMKETLDLSIEKKFSEHLDHNINDTVRWRNFLQDWISLIKSNNCVFCWQILDSQAKNLIEDYKRIFSGTYESLKRDIIDEGNKFVSLDFEKELLKFESLGVVLIENSWREQLIENKKYIDSKIKEKQLDFNKVLDLNSLPEFISFLQTYDQIKEKLQEISSSISWVINVNQLSSDLLKLENTKERHSNEYIIFFTELNELEEEIKEIKTNIQNKRTELTDRVNTIFSENLTNINEFLLHMWASFSLKELTPTIDSRSNISNYCQYSFIFEEQHEIKISNRTNQRDSEPENLPYFKNTLSDSERRTLAFAFFLSKLKNDPHLWEKILVLDDPFSSFDENRKQKTIQLLINLKNSSWDKPKQKIILTHEKAFFAMSVVLFSKQWENLKTFMIKNSDISLLDANEFIEEEYFQNIKYIQKAVDSESNLNEALGKARKCVEHILKRKYYLILLNNGTNFKSSSISAFLNIIWNRCEVKTEIEQLNLHDEHHDTASIFDLSATEKCQKLQEFLNLVEKI